MAESLGYSPYDYIEPPGSGDPRLVPVDHDPFEAGPRLVPVEHDPFGVGQAAGALAANRVIPVLRGTAEDALSSLYGMTGVPDIREGAAAFGRGEPLQGIGQMGAGLASLAALGAPAARGAMTLGREAIGAVPGVLGDIQGARVFHGSPLTDLRTIAANPEARQYDNATSQFGAFFAPNKADAERYAGETGRVYSADVDLKRPYEMPFKEFNYFQSPNSTATGKLEGAEWGARADQLKEEAAQFRDTLASLGYDGIVVRHPRTNAVMEMASFGDVPTGIKAFHGSPHDFERFDMSKIGTGEGAQAYGHGLYFAGNEDVARSYSDALSRTLTGAPGYDLATHVLNTTTLKNNTRVPPSIDEAISRLQTQIADYDKRGWPAPDYRNQYDTAISHLEDWKSEGVPTQGHMYEASINAEPEHFLDWDKPLSEQSEKVREVAKSLWPEGQTYIQTMTPNGTTKYITKSALDADVTGAELINAANGQFQKEEFTNKLREAGIPGIRYLDQGSRGTGEGTHNYVVFDDKLIDIIKKYGLGALIAGGAATIPGVEGQAQHLIPVEHDPFAPGAMGGAQ